MKTSARIFLGGLFVVTVFVATTPFVARPAYASDVDSPLQVAADKVTSASAVAIAAHTGVSATANTALQVKGFTLDGLAWAVAKAVLGSVINSTIKWINSGFKGAPAFATNLGSTLQTVGDTQANSFIQQLLTNGSIKSPFQNQVASAVSSSYFKSTGANGFFTQNAFTLGQASPNPAAFLQGTPAGFAQGGGFNAMISAGMNGANNPYGAYALAQNAIGQQVTQAQSNQKTELNWGSGFLSQKNCPASGGSSTSNNSLTSLSTANSSVVCSLGSIINPGSTIKTALDKNLGAGVDSLVTASQLNQLVSALLGQLINHVLGPGGLTGITQPSPTTNNVPYFSQTTNSAGQIVASGSGGTATQNLNSSFTATVQAQTQQLQTFQTEWNTINNAAEAAAVALQANQCANNATTLSTIVEPVIDRATTELAQASTSIADLNDVINELPAANSTSDDVTPVMQASCDYSILLGTTPSSCTPSSFITPGFSIPSPDDFQNALTQSTDTSGQSGVATSDFTEMNEVTAGASSCQPPPTQTTTPGT